MRRSWSNKQNRFAGRSDPGAQTRRLELHEGNESVHLRLVGHEPGQHASKA